MHPRAEWRTETLSHQTYSCRQMAIRYCSTSTWPASRSRLGRASQSWIRAERSRTWLPSGCSGWQYVIWTRMGTRSALRRPELTRDPTGTQFSLIKIRRANCLQRSDGPHQADIYALGVVIVEALTGRLPVSGDVLPLRFLYRPQPLGIGRELGMPWRVPSVLRPNVERRRPANGRPSRPALRDS